MMKSCDACARRVNEVRNFYGADVCARCAKDLREAYDDAPHTMRSPVSSGIRSMDPHSMGAPDTLSFPSDDDREASDAFDNVEMCPGCGSMPGDGITSDCNDPMGCGHNRANQDAAIGDAVADTQRSPHMKHESAKFDGNAYMEETVRLEEARKCRVTAPVNQESIGHVRQLRTQEHPNNRIRIGK